MVDKLRGKSRIARMTTAETARKVKTDAPKLDATAWTNAALEDLAIGGIQSVRVETLAKRLAVTKGSFYWHFKDRSALHENMLAHWRRRATLDLIERLDRGDMPAEERLRSLIRLPLAGRRSAWGADVELSIRLWGRSDERAQRTLQEVDELRLRYIAGLLAKCGVDHEIAHAQAIVIYCYMRVAATLIPAEASTTMDQCEALLTGLMRPPAGS